MLSHYLIWYIFIFRSQKTGDRRVYYLIRVTLLDIQNKEKFTSDVNVLTSTGNGKVTLSFVKIIINEGLRYTGFIQLKKEQTRLTKQMFFQLIQRSEVLIRKMLIVLSQHCIQWLHQGLLRKNLKVVSSRGKEEYGKGKILSKIRRLIYAMINSSCFRN